LAAEAPVVVFDRLREAHQEARDQQTRAGLVELDPLGEATVSAPSLLDLDGVAARLNLSTRHVRRLVAERRIPFLKVGSCLRFDSEQIELWLRSLAVCSFDPPPGN